ncbi:MAG: nucleotidyltransferase family protein [Alphaproteobacteria bacterium]|uniref:Nucleotidyltransferase family protein n=1 Tax=Candidatus Nitrobium versatile TaxID=2884831 RepID=A0A953J8X3_9BACT|nr:nucleotidyltransferase family protein [Candidatus Nitrobium versatile]
MDKVKPLLIAPETTIKTAMQKLNETSRKILFVVDESDKLLGTVTDGDIRRGIINGSGFNDRIGNIMQKKFIAVTRYDQNPREYAKRLMSEMEIEQIPVLDDKGVIVEAFFWSDFLEDSRRGRSEQLFDNHVVIMAGGKGTRLDPFTKILPKPLIPIGNKPIIEIIMDRFYRSGFNKFIYSLNYKKEYIKLFLKENNFPYHIDWIEEPDFLGTAGGLSLLKEKITDTFFISNCDTLLEIDFEEVLTWHKEQKAAITIIGSHNEVKIPFGVLELSNGGLGKILEKPVHDIIINTGAYVMEPGVISYIAEGQYMDMNELIEIAKKDMNVSVFPIYSGWLDIGQWEEYKRSLKIIGDQ